MTNDKLQSLLRSHVAHQEEAAAERSFGGARGRRLNARLASRVTLWRRRYGRMAAFIACGALAASTVLVVNGASLWAGLGCIAIAGAVSFLLID